VCDCIAAFIRTFGVEALTEHASIGCGALVDVGTDIVNILVTTVVAETLVAAERVDALVGWSAASGFAFVDIFTDTVDTLSIAWLIANTRVTTWDILTPIVKA